MSWHPSGEIVISASSEFMDMENLLKKLEKEGLTGYLALDSPEDATIFFQDGFPVRNIMYLRDRSHGEPYVAFFHKLPKTLFMLCQEILDSKEILNDQFKFVYEVAYFVDRIARTNFRGIVVLKKDNSYFLIFENGKPVAGAKWNGETFEVSRRLVGEILALETEVEEIHVFRKNMPFVHFEPKEMSESSSVKELYVIFSRFFSSLKDAISITRPILNMIYAPKIETYSSLLSLKSEAQDVYIARSYSQDPEKIIQMVNEFWDVFYKYPKKTNNALFIFPTEKTPASLQFRQDATSIQESPSPSGILARLGLNYETKRLGTLIEEMNAQKLKTLLDIYNLGTPEEKRLKNMKDEIIIKTLGSR